MSAEVAVSAPGKTILLGEHSAVYGHPALVAALDHRMTVAIRPARGAVHLAMPVVGVDGRFGWDDLVERARAARARWEDAFGGDESRAFDPVRAPRDLALLALGEVALHAGSASSLPGLDVRVLSDIPPRSGFGSSAALAVTVVAATLRALGRAAHDATVRELAEIVERSQHGRPSGVDLEAVLRGGVLWCRRRADGGLDADEMPGGSERLDVFRVFHSGAPRETTGEMVAAVRALRLRDPKRVAEAMTSLDAAAHDARTAIETGAREAWVPLVRRASEALEQLGVVPEAIARTIRAIETRGGAAKISGAGGISGDGAGLVLVVHPDPEWHARFEPPAAWTAHRVGLGAPGFREEVAA